MQFFKILILLFLFYSCSFDTKTGIWKNDNIVPNIENNSVFKDFVKITSSDEKFNSIVQINEEFNFIINEPLRNLSWNQTLLNKENNIVNLSFDNKNQAIHKSKKISLHTLNENILYEKNKIFLSDQKGNLFIYSLQKNKLIKKLNFYKKKYKNKKIKLNFIIENDIVYISDNIGFIYAYDINLDKIIWAKNINIPFRSNLKLSLNFLTLANQNNDLYFFNKKNGKLIKLIPSEETVINNNFQNKISLSNDEVFFLNTYGSLYSIDNKSFNLKWFVNLNKTLEKNLSNLFYGSDVVFYDNRILLSSNENFYIINSKNGSVLYKKNFSSYFNPIINNNFVFLLTKNNLLVALNLRDGEIIYSLDLAQETANFLSTKKKNLIIKNILMVDDKIFVFLKNSYVIKLDIYGKIVSIIKLPSKLKTQPIIVDNKLFYINKKNKLFVVN